MQKRIYRRDPMHGNMPRQATLGAGAMFLLAVALLRFEENKSAFVLIFSLFLLTNIVGWRIVLRRVAFMIEATRGSYMEEREVHQLRAA
jgi:hypothetical protein